MLLGARRKSGITGYVPARFVPIPGFPEAACQAVQSQIF
jgi:hypothetical protein